VATARTHDDDLCFLGKAFDFARVGLVDGQRYGLRDFGHDGKAGRRNAGGQDDGTRQDIPEQSAAINCSHLFAPWFKIDRTAGKAENNLISLPGLGRDALATLIAFCKRTGYGAAKT
jgi:hypothetical protein